MKNFIPTLFTFIVVGALVYFGLTKFSGVKSSESAIKFDQDYAEILKDYKVWSEYNKENIELAHDFVPFDEEEKKILKKDFLEKLKTGDYVPVKGTSKNKGEIAYKLFKLNKELNPKAGRTAKSNAASALHYYQMEGKPFPNFNLTDLNDNNYSSETLKGKILVVKCWFIRCKVCVEEFPELNALYDRYEGNDKVEFLSVAFDKTEKLKAFLSKKEFRYPVVAEQQKFIMKELKAKQFPLHVLVDDKGNILKMVNNVHTLIHYLDKTTGTETPKEAKH